MKRPHSIIKLLCLLLLAVPAALAQEEEAVDNPVEIRVEIFLVSEVQGEEQFRPATTARPGQTVEYRFTAANIGPDTLPQGSVEILGQVPQGTTYVPNSATPSSERILTEFSADGGQSFYEDRVFVEEDGERRLAGQEEYDAILWTLLVDMEPGQEEQFFYRVTVDR